MIYPQSITYEVGQSLNRETGELTPRIYAIFVYPRGDLHDDPDYWCIWCIVPPRSRHHGELSDDYPPKPFRESNILPRERFSTWEAATAFCTALIDSREQRIAQVEERIQGVIPQSAPPIENPSQQTYLP